MSTLSSLFDPYSPQLKLRTDGEAAAIGSAAVREIQTANDVKLLDSDVDDIAVIVDALLEMLLRSRLMPSDRFGQFTLFEQLVVLLTSACQSSAVPAGEIS